MKINLAALALAASAAAMPMSAADTTSNQAITTTSTVTVHPKTRKVPPDLASLVSSFLRLPSETPEIHTSIVEPTAVPKATHGLGDGLVEACVMPDGCRDEDKHDEPPSNILPAKVITVPTAVPSATDDPKFLEPCVMPNGCRDEDKHDVPPMRTRPTKVITTAVPRAIDDPKGVDPIEPCVMPNGCRDEDKHDEPPLWIIPPKVITLTTTTRKSRTVSVPTETSGVADSITITITIPSAETTSVAEPSTTIVPIEEMPIVTLA